MARNNGGTPSEDLDNYVNDLADLGDSGDHDHDTDTQTTDQSTDRTTNDSTTTQDHTQQTSKEPAGTTDQTTGKQPTAKTQQQGQDKTQTTQPTQQQLKPLGNGVFADGEGNLVSQDGKLIAEKGFAARIHQQNQRFRTQNEQLNGEVTQLRTRVTELASLDNSMRQAGINADEMAQALDFASRYKRGDVLGIAKEIVALAMASGHNATDILGQGVGDSIDMRAVKALMDERLGPVQKSRQEDERKAQAERTARENYNRFVSENEYSDVHADAIVNLAKRENVSLQTAYNRLFQFAVQNQFDFSRRLDEQIHERQQQQSTQQQQQPTPTPKPMPNGATTRTNGALPTAVEPMNSADDDWGTILRQAMNTTM